MTRPDPTTLAAADLTTALRTWLRARREPPQVQAAALTYELAAHVAKHASTVGEAFNLLDQWTGQMKAQIATMGVGVEHP